VSAQVRAQVSDQVLAQVSDQVSDQVRDQVRDQVSAQVRAQVRAQVSDQVLDKVSAQVRAQVLDKVSAQVRAQVSDQVRAQVLDKVSAQVSAQVRAQVLDKVSAQVRAQVSDWHWPNFWGSHDAGWWWNLSFYETVRDFGVVDAKRLNPWFSAARACGWCWMYWDIVIVSDRPSVCKVDDRGRLHCSDGPSVAYLDGTEVWAWHGVRVPRRVIESPWSYAAEEYRALPAEQRRALGEHLGWDRVLGLLGSSTVDTCEADGLSYALIACSDGSKYLQMLSPTLQDGTQPVYLEPAHEDLRTAAGARKWRVARRDDGSWWTAEECDDDPSLSIGQHA